MVTHFYDLVFYVHKSHRKNFGGWGVFFLFLNLEGHHKIFPQMALLDKHWGSTIGFYSGRERGHPKPLYPLGIMYGWSRNTFQGDIRGVVEQARGGQDFVAFYGVPFAQPPIGELRWKPPKPPSKWDNVRKFCLSVKNINIWCVITSLYIGKFNGNERQKNKLVFLNVKLKIFFSVTKTSYVLDNPKEFVLTSIYNNMFVGSRRYFGDWCWWMLSGIIYPKKPAATRDRTGDL